VSFFRAVYDAFASYRAAIIRLDGLLTANERSRTLTRLAAETRADGLMELDDVAVRSPSGDALVEGLAVRLAAGDSLVITGRSGSGNTTLLRTLAQMWPYASGLVRYPSEDGAMFASASLCVVG
jgi:putative ATP-binding cassette transporter